MNIFCEDSLLYAEDFFQSLGNCGFFAGATVTSDDIQGANALVVRSTTNVSSALLEQCEKLAFVGTGTAGFNHIDMQYLASRNIPAYAAAGCNSIAVVEYVLCAMLYMSVQRNKNLFQQKVGIVGVGNIGSLLNKRLQDLGIHTCLYDPPLQESGALESAATFDEILACDWISLHVPLINSGHYPTLHMFGEQELSQLSAHQCLINACRGEVVNNRALLALKRQGHEFGLIMDVWEQEPDILFELTQYADLATGHIAGHTIEGKGRGTEMMYQALCRQLGKTPNLVLSQFLPKINNKQLSFSNGNEKMLKLLELVKKVYDIENDSQCFKKTVKNSDDFRAYRKHYAGRREFSSFTVNTDSLIDSQVVHDLGFSKT